MFKTAVDWICDNKTWLFSGGGVVAGGLLWKFGRRLLGAGRHLLASEGSLSDPSTVAAKPTKTLEEAKATTHILFIDDEIKFKVVTILQKAGWIHTKIVKDITSFSEDAVTRARIFFIDINGVGKKMEFKDEGLGLALALKTHYPNKSVVIYSADTRAERFHEAWKRADTYLAKNADPYEFQQIVEELALKP